MTRTPPRALRRKAPTGWEVYYRVVRTIAPGRVCTYGQVAALAGNPRAARQVGYAMAALHGGAHGVPWHRVLGARPRERAAISLQDPGGAAMQRMMLEAEGVRFDARGQIALAQFGHVQSGRVATAGRTKARAAVRATKAAVHPGKATVRATKTTVSPKQATRSAKRATARRRG